MNILIVYAHQEAKSFNAALKDLAISSLRTLGHTVKVSDLYGMNFKAVTDRDDFTVVYDRDYFKYQNEQRNASTRGNKFSADILEEQEKLVWADLVIFQFPLWWFSMPAILKGWMDRILAVGFAYGGGRLYDTGVFKGKKAMLVITTGAPSSVFTPTGMALAYPSKILFPIHHGTLYYVGMSILQPFIAWQPARIGPQGREQYLEDYKKRLLSLETTPVILPHRLSDYDE